MLEKSVEILISTMNKSFEDNSFFDKLNVKTDAVVINQSENENCQKTVLYNNNQILWKDSNTRGLSKSRNLALGASTGKYLLICDDDEELVENYESIISSAFENQPNADIIAFKVNGIEEHFKDYSDNKKRIGYLSSLSISSVQIAIKRDSVINSKVSFDEMFGSGAKYKMGEENIFLFDCLKKKMRIYYIPELIANLHMGKSTWFFGFTKEYFFNRGAVYYRLFGKHLGIIMLHVFALKNYKRIKMYMKYKEAMTFMVEGLNSCGDVK